MLGSTNMGRICIISGTCYTKQTKFIRDQYAILSFGCISFNRKKHLPAKFTMQIISTILTGLHRSGSHFQTSFASFVLLTFQMFAIGLRTGTTNLANFTVMELLGLWLRFWTLCFHVSSFLETLPTLVRSKHTNKRHINNTNVLKKKKENWNLASKPKLTHYSVCLIAVRHTLWLHCTMQHHSLNSCWL